MLTLPALKIQQFAKEFYLLNLSAGDVERLVRFEVLGETGIMGKKVRKTKATGVNWGELEKKVGTSDKAFQRPIIRKKIDELAQYYTSCRESDTLPAIPGSVILTTDDEVSFTPAGANPFLGLLQLTEEEGSLRALDGQHRLLALAALLHDPATSEEDRAAARRLQVPAILFNGLSDDQIVELFVTINAKHTRLNASLLVSLSGRQLYGDARMGKVHDAIRALNNQSSSPLAGQIKLLGVGPGRVQQAGLAQEMKQMLDDLEGKDASLVARFEAEAKDFFLAYFKEIARVFEQAWNGKKYSIKSSTSLRAFIQVTPEVLARALAVGGASRTDALRTVLAPWGERIGDARFETTGAWRAKIAGGGKETTRLLARELVAALGGVA
jgi:DGQHR domain-containing protein